MYRSSPSLASAAKYAHLAHMAHLVHLGSTGPNGPNGPSGRTWGQVGQVGQVGAAHLTRIKGPDSDRNAISYIYILRQFVVANKIAPKIMGSHSESPTSWNFHCFHVNNDRSYGAHLVGSRMLGFSVKAVKVWRSPRHSPCNPPVRAHAFQQRHPASDSPFCCRFRLKGVEGVSFDVMSDKCWFVESAFGGRTWTRFLVSKHNLRWCLLETA